MTVYTWVAIAALALLLKPAVAQQRPQHGYHLTEPDQELDYVRFKGIHRISAQLRGVRGSGSTLYWVSADGKRLTAYRRGRLLWQTNVAQAFVPGASIERLVLASGVVFVFTSHGGHAEVSRATGKLAAVGVDK